MKVAGTSALTGIALTLGAVAFFAILDTATKLVLGAVPLLMALWFRYFLQAVVTTPKEASMASINALLLCSTLLDIFKRF